MNICRILLFFASLLICLSSWSQVRVLQVENIETGKKVYIKPQQKIRLIVSSDTLKGRVTFVSDSTLSIGNQTIAMNSISSIINREVKKGMTCVVLGSVGVFSGVVYYLATSLTAALGSAFGEGPISANYTAPILLIGGSSATFVTGTVLLLRKQVYPNTKYSYRIVL